MRCLSTRRGLAAGLLALTTCLALASCKDKTDENGNTVNVTLPKPGAEAPKVVTTGTNAATTNAAAAAFESPRKPDGEVSIQIITNNSSEFWATMAKGMDEGAKEVGCKAERKSPPGTQPTNNDQKTVFEQVMAANPDGIAVSPIEASAFAPEIDNAIAAKVPVITFDSDAPTSKRLAYLGTNNYEAGKRAGEEAVRLLPNGGNMVAFVGNMSAQNARDRYQGFLDAIKGHNINMLQDPYQDKADQVGAAHRNVQDAITKYGDKINGFLGIWAYNGPAIVSEVMKTPGLRQKVKIVCFDGAKQTLDNLKAGNIDSAIVQKPYEFGRLSTKLLFLINRKGFTAAMNEMKPELEKLGMKLNGNIIDTGVEIVTPANAADFINKLKEKGLEST